MELWLTRQRNGMYMLTHEKPVLMEVEGRNYEDAYVPYGDPVGMRNFCDLILKVIGSDRKLNFLESVRIDLTGKILT